MLLTRTVWKRADTSRGSTLRSERWIDATALIATLGLLASCGGDSDTTTETEPTTAVDAEPTTTATVETTVVPTTAPSEGSAETTIATTVAPTPDTAGDDISSFNGLPDVADVAYGATLIGDTDQYDDDLWSAVNLIDGRADRGWSANEPVGSFVIGVAHPEITAVGIDTTLAQEDEFPGISATRVSIERATSLNDYPDFAWEPVATIDAEPGSVTIVETPGLTTAALRFTVESNGGDPEFVEIMEVMVYATPTDNSPSLGALVLGGFAADVVGDRWAVQFSDGAVIGCTSDGRTMELEGVDGGLRGEIDDGNGNLRPVRMGVLVFDLTVVVDIDGKPTTWHTSTVEPDDTSPCTAGQSDEPADAVIEMETTPADQREVDPPLVVAASRGDLDEVNAELSAGVNPDIARERDGTTPLIFAAQDGHTDVVLALLEAGVTVDRGNDGGWTALMIASQNGHDDVVAALLESGASPRVGRSDNWTALHSAVFRNRPGVVAQLIEAGAPVEAAESGFTPLTLAAQEGNDAVITMLLDAGARVGGVSAAGPTPLAIAAQNDAATSITLLLDAGGDPDAGGTLDPPLLMAAARGYLQSVEVLIEGGADVDIQRGDGITALHWAAYDDDPDLARLLLGLGADPSIRDEDDRTPLQLAVIRNSEDASAVLGGS